jgi:hypothetical protein
LAGKIPRFRSTAKGEIDHGAYRIDRDFTSSSLAMADNLPQEAPEAFAKAVIDVDGF